MISNLQPHEGVQLVDLAISQPELVAVFFILHDALTLRLPLELFFDRIPSASDPISVLGKTALLCLGLPQGPHILLSVVVDHLISQLPRKARADGAMRCLPWLNAVLNFLLLSATINELPAFLSPSAASVKLTTTLQSSCLPFLLQLVLSLPPVAPERGLAIGLLVLTSRLMGLALQHADPATDSSSPFVIYTETLLVHALSPGPLSENRGNTPVLFVEAVNLANMLLARVSHKRSIERLTSTTIRPVLMMDAFGPIYLHALSS